MTSKFMQCCYLVGVRQPSGPRMLLIWGGELFRRSDTVEGTSSLILSLDNLLGLVSPSKKVGVLPRSDPRVFCT